MKTLTGLVVTAFLLVSAPLAAQTAESPRRFTWLATPCATWGCAVAALASSEGDPNVFVLPTKSTAYPWVVIKRVESGAIEGPIDETFRVDCFDGIAEASAHFSATDHEKIPILVTTPDGSMLVVCMHGKEPTKRRAVR